MANSKMDTYRTQFETSLGISNSQAVGNTNTDLERRALGITLGLTGTALVSKSLNDLRKLNNQTNRDY